MNRISKIAASILAVAIISGCSGGKSGNTPVSNNGSNGSGNGGTPQQERFNGGQVADGYIAGANVLIDINTTHKGFSGFDKGDINKTTDSNGNFSVEKDDNVSIGTFIYARGGKNVATGEDFNGTLKAVYDGGTSVMLTPVTTMVAAQIENESNVTKDQIEQAKQKVAEALNIPLQKVTADPVKDKDALKATQKVVAIAKVISAKAGDNNITDVIEKVADNLKDSDDANLTKAVEDAAQEKGVDKNVSQAAIETAKAVEEAIDEVDDSVNDNKVIENIVTTYVVNHVVNAVENNETNITEAIDQAKQKVQEVINLAPAAECLTFDKIKGANSSNVNVTSDLNLSAKSLCEENNITITWINHGDNIELSGSVTQENYESVNSFLEANITKAGKYLIKPIFFTIAPKGHKPQLKDDLVTINEDTNKTINVLRNDSDADGDTLTIKSITQPAHGHAQISDDNKSVIYSPDKDYFGNDSLVYTVKDPLGAEVNATVNIVIKPVNDAPVLADIANKTINEDNNLTIPLSATDAENDPITYSATSSNESIAGVIVNGSQLMILPKPNMNGNVNITVTASDGNGGEDSKTFVLTINPVNDAPIANNDTFNISTKEPFAMLDVLANDSDIDGDTLTITHVSNPQSGTVSIVNNKIKYEPVSDFNGTVTFSYTISDGNATATANVTIDVTRYVRDAERALNEITAFNSENDDLSQLISDVENITKDSNESDAQAVYELIELVKSLNTNLGNMFVINNDNNIIEQLLKGNKDIAISSALNTIDTFSDVSSQSLSEISSQIDNAVEKIVALYSSDPNYVFKYRDFRLNKNDVAGLIAILELQAASLDYMAAYKVVKPEYVTRKTKNIDGVNYEYRIVDVNPVAVLNDSTTLSLRGDAQSHFDSSKAHLLTAIDSVKQFNASNSNLSEKIVAKINKFKEIATKIENSLNGKGGYQINVGNKTVYINVATLFNEQTAPTLSTLIGNDFAYGSECDGEYNEDLSIINNRAMVVCTDGDQSYPAPAKIEPNSVPTTNSSHLDDIVEKVDTPKGQFSNGDDIINILLNSKLNIEKSISDNGIDLSVEGGSAPYTWTLLNAPEGVSLENSDGNSTTVLFNGIYNEVCFGVKVEDKYGNSQVTGGCYNPIDNYPTETRQVVSQDGIYTYTLKVQQLSNAHYENGDFWTDTNPPQKILPITITNGKNLNQGGWAVNIPGVYAGQIVKLSIDDRPFFNVDLTGIDAGDTKTVNFDLNTTNDNNNSGGDDNNNTGGDNNSTGGDNNNTGGDNNLGGNNSTLLAQSDELYFENVVTLPLNIDVVSNDTGIGTHSVEVNLVEDWNNSQPVLTKELHKNGATWIVESNNTITFLPDHDFNGGDQMITYQIRRDDGQTSMALIQLHMPVYLQAYSDFLDINTTTLEPVTVNVLANDGYVGNVEVYLKDWDNGQEILTKTVQTNDGTWQVNNNNEITFTPSSNFINGGEVTTPYIIRNENNDTAQSFVYITYNYVGSQLEAHFDYVDANSSDHPINIDVLQNDVVPDMDNVEVYLISYDEHGQNYVTTKQDYEGIWRVEANKTITFIPNSNFNGSRVYSDYVIKYNNQESEGYIEIHFPVFATQVCPTTTLSDVEDVLNKVKENLIYDNGEGEVHFNNDLSERTNYVIDSNIFVNSSSVNSYNDTYFVSFDRKEYHSYEEMNNDLAKEELDYGHVVFNNGQWVLNNIEVTNDAGHKYIEEKTKNGNYQHLSDGSYNINDGNKTLIKVKFVRDLSSSEIEAFLAENNISISLDANDTAKLMLEKEVRNDIDWWYNDEEFNENSYNSLNDFIADYSYDSNRSYSYKTLLHSNNNYDWVKAIQFAPNSATNTSGTLVEVNTKNNQILTNNAGTWEIRDITENNETYTILVVKPILCGYKERIFRLMGDRIVKGQFNKKVGQVDASLVFSKSLAQKIKNIILQKATYDLDPNTPASPEITDNMLANKKFYMVKEDNETQVKYYTVLEFVNGALYVDNYRTDENGTGVILDNNFTANYHLENGMIYVEDGGPRVSLTSIDNDVWHVVTRGNHNEVSNEEWLLNRPSDLPEDLIIYHGNNNGGGTTPDNNGTNNLENNSTDIIFEEPISGDEYNSVNAAPFDTSKVYYKLEYSQDNGNMALEIDKYVFNEQNNTIIRYKYNNGEFVEDGQVSYSIDNNTNIITVTIPDEGTFNVKFISETNATNIPEYGNIFQSGDIAYEFYGSFADGYYGKYLWFNESAKDHFINYVNGLNGSNNPDNNGTCIVNPITANCED